MYILINTGDSFVTIDGCLFPPGEWIHVQDDFTVDNTVYPDVKNVNQVLNEKLALIQSGATAEEVYEIVVDQHIDGFVNGILEAGYGD